MSPSCVRLFTAQAPQLVMDRLYAEILNKKKALQRLLKEREREQLAARSASSGAAATPSGSARRPGEREGHTSASGSGQKAHDDEGQGDEEVASQRRQVINKRITMGRKQCVLAAVLCLSFLSQPPCPSLGPPFEPDQKYPLAATSSH
ncbi:hypothetical protein QJQ45_004062 [Haematococcus lacustris]|nr:hypothetical protein QJQ45_004062 [Haematococcus lacustris]